MIIDRLKSKDTAIGVVGLGYVGLPLAVEFAKHFRVIGFDINDKKIDAYRNGIDLTQEVGDEVLSQSPLELTSDEKKLRDCSFVIVAVPTPTNKDTTPDLSLVVNASRIVGGNLRKDSIVVFESTVYPGVTEDVCLPEIEKASGMKLGVDFKLGYSPERINPGDKVHRVWNIKKIVSGSDKEALAEISAVYGVIIQAGVFPVSTIKTAEAVKVLENSQRDINIAFMNEAAMIFHKMGIDTQEVIEGMNTKWNALGFTPGLVGGHCIGVDPYYLTHAAEQLGYHSQIISAGRRVNDQMGSYIADCAIKEMVKAKIDVSSSKVLLAGITFKENCADVRNSKAFDTYFALKDYGITADVYDPIASCNEVMAQYGIEMVSRPRKNTYSCIIVAVKHREFQNLDYLSLFRAKGHKVLVDVKGALVVQPSVKDLIIWRL